MLKFGDANSKLRELEKLTGHRIGTFSIPAGRTCPGALTCKAWVRADPVTGQRKLIDGPKAETRCFAANDEATYPQTFRARRHNLELLRKAKTADRIADLIVASIPKKYSAIRWHVSGDFYSRAYMLGMFRAFERMPERRAWFYTKSLPVLADLADRKPPNVSVSASLGGKFDALAFEHGMRTASIVLDPSATDLPIDHDDRHALEPNTGQLGGTSFGLLIHGTQQPGTKGSQALIKLRREGIKTGYSRTG